ncbi:MAG: hypothetical protein IJE93_06930 [Clostridia bacterium]|nr:hypothetical protein [Clostridia bacterium]
MTVEVLFNEVCGLFGDAFNAQYLEKCIPDSEFIYTALCDKPYFEDNTPDIILMGAMSEKTQRAVIKKLLPLKNRILELIDKGVVFLATGNAFEVFTKEIDYVSEEIKSEGLGIFDLTVKTDYFNRYNGKVLGKFNGEFEITGIRSQFSFVYGNNSDGYFVKSDMGIGINPESKLEGVRRNNFFGTHLLGPVLVQNPPLCEYIISLAGGTPRLAFEEQARSAYTQRLKEMKE